MVQLDYHGAGLEVGETVEGEVEQSARLDYDDVVAQAFSRGRRRSAGAHLVLGRIERVGVMHELAAVHLAEMDAEQAACSAAELLGIRQPGGEMYPARLGFLNDTNTPRMPRRMNVTAAAKLSGPLLSGSSRGRSAETSTRGTGMSQKI